MKKSRYKVIMFALLLFVSSINVPALALNKKVYNIPKGKTVWLLDKNSTNRQLTWQTNSPQTITVLNGVIYAKEKGQANVTVAEQNVPVVTYTINVTEPEGVKFTYTYPNNPGINEKFDIMAITDLTIDGVRFNINMGNVNTVLNATSKNRDADTYIWSVPYLLSQEGEYTFKTEFLKNNKWHCDQSGNGEIFVQASGSAEPSVCEKRVSDKCIDVIASFEGFSQKLNEDILVEGTHEIGYGTVINPGESFYNNITKNEARVYLGKFLNKRSGKTVNSLLCTNNIAFNQQQLDALVSLTYNIGPRWSKKSRLSGVILNCSAEKPIIKGTVNCRSMLNIRQLPDTKSGVLKALPCGEKVTVLTTVKFNERWYWVKTQAGDMGFCFDEFINLSEEGKVSKNSLDNMSIHDFVREFLEFHHVGGKCINGLLYRRIDELEIFLFGNYKRDGSKNIYGFPTKCTVYG